LVIRLAPASVRPLRWWIGVPVLLAILLVPLAFGVPALVVVAYVAVIVAAGFFGARRLTVMHQPDPRIELRPDRLVLHVDAIFERPQEIARRDIASVSAMRVPKGLWRTSRANATRGRSEVSMVAAAPTAFPNVRLDLQRPLVLDQARRWRWGGGEGVAVIPTPRAGHAVEHLGLVLADPTSGLPLLAAWLGG
jgi:hypothetical protein